MVFACYFPKNSQNFFFSLRGGFSALEAQLEKVQAKFSQRISKGDQHLKVLGTFVNAGVTCMNQCICIKQLLFSSWYKVLASFCWPPYQADRFIYASTGERVQDSRCPQREGEVCHLGKACRDQRIQELLQELCSRQAS